MTSTSIEPGPESDIRLRPVENLISRVLLLGGLLSIVIVVAGLSFYVAGGPARAQVAKEHRVVRIPGAARPHVSTSIRQHVPAA